jgi:LmbE family N-acetylglucosaminyl deacetylase
VAYKTEVLLKKILVVAPHADDETLGAGGTLCKWRICGEELFWLIVTNKNEKYGYNSLDVTKRREEIKKVETVTGFTETINLELKPAGLDRYPVNELIGSIDSVISRIVPDSIIIPFHNDAHSDHRIVFQAVWGAVKIFRQPSVKTVLMMEIPSETDFAAPASAFHPNFFVDIGSEIETKISTMSLYKGEMGKHPFPRSETAIRSLASHRGSQAGCSAAEGFMLVKHIA